MGLFGGKNDKDKEKKKEQPLPQLPSIPQQKRLFIPKRRINIDVASREYKIFRQRDIKMLSWYERLCRLSAKIFHSLGATMAKLRKSYATLGGLSISSSH